MSISFLKPARCVFTAFHNAPKDAVNGICSDAGASSDIRVLKTLKASGSVFVKHQQLSGSCLCLSPKGLLHVSPSFYLEALRN